MNYIFTGRNIDITKAIKEFTEKKIGKLEKFFSPETEVHTKFEVNKNRQKAEVTIKHNGKTYRAKDEREDLYASIDKAADIIEGQLRKNKASIEKKIKSKSIKLEHVKSIKDDESIEGLITKFKKYSVKPMTIEDAVANMRGLEDAFRVFLNAETKKVNVVYVLKNGNIGLIEPEK
jgi:putative sigma-54 modulation protein